MRNLRVISCLIMALAVACGAFGAHGLEAVLTPKMLEVWKTAVLYQALHGLALFSLSVSPYEESAKRPALLMTAGIVLFSGSLYALVLSGFKPLGLITPLGGTTLVVAWIWFAISLNKEADTVKS